MNRKLVKEIINYEGQSSSIILATIISTEGSSPRNTGTQMLVYPGGDITGTIGGGPVEADIIKKAGVLLEDDDIKRKVEKHHYNIDNEHAAQVGGICGGKVEVLLEKIDLNS